MSRAEDLHAALSDNIDAALERFATFDADQGVWLLDADEIGDVCQTLADALAAAGFERAA